MKSSIKKFYGIVISLVMVFTLYMPSISKAESKPVLKVTLDNTELQAGDEVNATVSLNTNGTENITALQIYLKYDNTKLESKGDPTRLLPSYSSEFCLLGTNQELGEACMTWSIPDYNFTNYNGDLMKCSFVVKENASIGDSDIQIYYDNSSDYPYPVRDSVAGQAVESTILNSSFTVEKKIQAISFEGNKTSAELNVGQTDTLTVVYDPTDTTDDKTVTWTSSKTSVVTVSNGIVTAVGPGTSTVTAKVGDKTATCTYTVKAPLTSIELNNGTDEIELLKGQTKTVGVKFNPENTTDEKTVTWESLNEDIATVDSNGKITAIKEGTATIKATSTVSNAITDSITVTVTEVPLNSIAIEQVDDTMLRWDRLQLNVIYNPENTTDEKTVTWESSNETIAIVDENGMVTALKEGTVTIKATTANGKEAEKEIMMPQGQVTDI